MDIKLLGLLTIFLIAALLPEAECWRRRRWRIRIRLRRIWKPICRWTCPRVCKYYTGQGTICSFVCKNVCGRKKRGTEDEYEGHVTPLPRNFDFYDLNDDGFIELEEMGTTLGETKANCEQMFNLTDTDRPYGKLSLDEFENGPMVFETYPGDDDDDQGDGNPGRGGGDGNPGQGEENVNPGQSGENGNPGQGGENGNPGQGEDNGNPGQSGENGNPGQGGENGNPGQGGENGNPGQGGENGNPGQGVENGNPGQGGNNGNPGQGAGNGNGGNQGSNPDQRSI